jgi:hypothetical protein
MRLLDGNCRLFGLPSPPRVSVYGRTICEREQGSWRIGQTIMMRAHQYVGGLNRHNYLWLRICAGLAAYRRRRVAAILYAELSKLSDAELRHRGLARDDLHRLASDDRTA